MHPYLRAYMAGIVLPTIVMPIAIAVISLQHVSDHLFHVLVLRLDDLVGGASTMSELAGPAQVFACHRLHRPCLTRQGWDL